MADAPREAAAAGREAEAAADMAGGPRGDALLTDAPLDVAALAARVARAVDGAVCTFAGIVRDHHEGRAVDHIVYEAYPAMARAELAAIVAEAEARWPEARVAAAHRTGRLEIGAASVAVAASAPHRAEAFAACRYVIDEIKRRVPIWKHEFGPDGARWVEGVAPAPLDGPGA